jgi:hypothetical protein
MREVATSFPLVVVPFRAVAGGRDGEHLVAVVRELYSELGYATSESDPVEARLAASSELWEQCGEAEHGLASRLRRELARLAEAALNEGALGESDGIEQRAMRSALDGAELVIRGEIAAQRAEAISEQLPGIAFIIVLPALGRERALALSRRAEELLSAAPEN